VIQAYCFVREASYLSHNGNGGAYSRWCVEAKYTELLQSTERLSCLLLESVVARGVIDTGLLAPEM
jgi:hypothetical protein